LSPEGFESRSLFKSHLTKWSEIERFTTARVKYNTLVGFYYSKEYKKAKLLKKVAVALSGVEGMLPDNYGKKPRELAVLMNEWRERYSAKKHSYS